MSQSAPADLVLGDEGRGRYTKEDIIALRVFKDNEKLLTGLRAVFYQQDISPEIKGIFKGNHNLLSSLTKMFTPVVSTDVPIHANLTRWAGDRRYADLLTNECKTLVLSRQDSINFFKNGIKRLSDIVDGNNGNAYPLTIDLNMDGDYESKSAEEIKRAIVAWQDSIPFIEDRLYEILMLASLRDETPAEKEERLKKDSAK